MTVSLKRKLNHFISRSTILRFMLGYCLGCTICIYNNQYNNINAALKEYAFILKTNVSNTEKCKLESHFIAPEESNKLLYVGVLTTAEYMDTRVEVINKTWKNGISGFTQFFVGADGKDKLEERRGDFLPLRFLPKVHDSTYPPQKKSIMVLTSMHNLLNSGFDWFMRADDDVYVRGDKLRKLLVRLDTNKPIFLGQRGLGDEKDIGKLGLGDGGNYCMGGPGIIFSREVLRRIGPHLKKCLTEMYTTHEDVELGRCVRRFAGIGCTIAVEANELFHEFYNQQTGYVDPFNKRHNQHLPGTITLHPNKNPSYHYSVHHYYLQQKILEKLSRVSQIDRYMKRLYDELKLDNDIQVRAIGRELSNRLVNDNFRKDSAPLQWDFFNRKHLLKIRGKRWTKYCAIVNASFAMVGVVKHLATMTMKKDSAFHHVNYVYEKISAPYHVQYKMELVYKEKKSRRKTKAKRKAWKFRITLQQNFIPAFMKERSILNKQKLLKMG